MGKIIRDSGNKAKSSDESAPETGKEFEGFQLFGGLGMKFLLYWDAVNGSVNNDCKI